MIRLIMIALNPKVIIKSFSNGSDCTLSLNAFADFFNSIHLKKTNSKNAMLQMKVNLDKKVKMRMKKYLWRMLKLSKNKNQK